MKLSDYIVEYLEKNGVDAVFELCGGSIIHILDSLHKSRSIKIVSMHHEQAASIAAEGFARCKGDIGVAMATSGPGATNMITGIASCFFDSVPCVFITGQVNTYEFKFNKPVRQVGFQETDIVSIVRPIVKYAQIVDKPAKIRYCLEKAFYLARSGRPGPVLLDIPMNIQRQEIQPARLRKFKLSPAKTCGFSVNPVIGQVAKALRDSKRPIIIAGGGIRIAQAQDELSALVNKANIPVVNSLMGVDAFSHNSRFYCGMLGSYGNRYANLAVANSDLILALGTRLDTRQTGTRVESFARGAKIIHVDIDKSELNNKIKADLAINCDLKIFLQAINRAVNGIDKTKAGQWVDLISGYKKNYSKTPGAGNGAISPNLFMEALSEFLPDDAVLCVDIGQNQIWAAQSIRVGRKMRFLTQGGMGAMGSALPMSIGAASAHPRKMIVAICGDGGFQLNSQELQTVFHYKLPIKVILINNSCYGMVRQFQEQYFNSVFQSTVIGYSHPDFVKLALAYKIKALSLNNPAGINKACKWLFAGRQPALLEVNIPTRAQALPKLSVNRPIEDQDPLLPREELEKLMIKKGSSR